MISFKSYDIFSFILMNLLNNIGLSFYVFKVIIVFFMFNNFNKVGIVVILFE